MRKMTAGLLLVTAAIILGGCGNTSSADTAADSQQSTAADTTSETEKESEEAASSADTQEEEQTEEKNQAQTAAEGENEGQEEELYAEILSNYKAAMEYQPTAQQLSEADLNPMLAYFYDAASGVPGYVIEDFDGNGVRELLVGVNSDAVEGTQIFDLYTITDGAPLKVINAGERDSYAVKSDNTFYNTGSSSATQTVFIQYELQGDYLYNMLQVEYNSELNADSPYFLVDGENYTPLTNSELEAYCGKLSGDLKTLDLTPFTE